MNSINNNLMALKTANMLNRHYSNLATSVERLSTGLRINSAADDAAGLAIRELMRVDVAALHQGARNANDAISMLQVADGALAVIDEKLIRMKELAEQAATGTYDSTQRLMIHSEFVAMGAEIDRIARSTEFNGIKLLDGSLSGRHNGSWLSSTGAMKIHFGAGNDSAEDYYYVAIGDCTLAGLGMHIEYDLIEKDPWGVKIIDETEARNILAATNDFNITKFTYTGHAHAMGQFGGGSTGAGLDASINAGIILGTGQVLETMDSGKDEEGTVMGTDEDPLLTLIAGDPNDPDRISSDAAMIDIEFSTSSNTIYFNFVFATDEYPVYLGDPFNDACGIFLDGVNYAHLANVIAIDGQPPQRPLSGPITLNNIFNQPDLFVDNQDRSGGLIANGISKTLRIGIPVTPGAKHTLHLSVADISDSVWDSWILVSDLSTAESSPAQKIITGSALVDIRTQDRAQLALESIDRAIENKDKIRAHLGAMQNRLENTVTNLTIQGDNLQAAESRISDTDIASEMTHFVRNQVLTQSAVAMLGQANNFPNMLFSLLNA